MHKSYKDAAWDYCCDVINGKFPAGEYVVKSCQRHIRDLRRKNFAYYYDPVEADRAIAFFEGVCRLSGGEFEGTPFLLFGWQKFVVCSIFGWKRKDNHTRRFRKAYIETGKGSGKSPLASGIALRLVCADNEPRAEGFFIARTSDQSMVTFKSAVAIVEQSELLLKRSRILGGTRPERIVYNPTKSFLQRVSSDRQGRHSGPIPHCVIVDEYHEHETSHMRDIYAAGVKSRRQPLILMITNSGVSFSSPCGQEHLYARKIVDQVFEDEQYFTFVCSIANDDEPMEDESCWIKSNPSLCVDPKDEGKPGVISIPGYEYIRSQRNEAVGMPSKRSIVERLAFCRWMDAEEPWIDPDVWRKCEVEELSPYEKRKDKWCWLALDLSKRIDLSAGCAVWDMEDGTLEAECMAWTPKDTLAVRSQIESIPYDEFVARGDLVATPGSIVDYAYIARWIKEMDERYLVAGVAYDPFGFRYLELELEKIHIETTRIPGGGLLIVPHKQGFQLGGQPGKYKEEDDEKGFNLWMPNSINNSEDFLLNQKIKIKINYALRTAIAGTVVIADASENRRLSKQKSLTRIDPAQAFVMAVGAVVDAQRTDIWRPVQSSDQLFGSL